MRFIGVACAFLLIVSSLQAQKRDVHKRTRVIELIEKAGLARERTPVEVTLRFERDAVKDPQAVRLTRVEGERRTAVPCQVLDITAHTATDSFAPSPQMFVQVIFLADVPANGKASYEVTLEDGAPPQPGEPLRVTGDGLGKAIDASAAIFDLKARSGQLLSCIPKSISEDRFVFLQRKETGPVPIHWNPDVWAIGATWGHTHSWTTPIAFDAKKHQADAPPDARDKDRPFFFREWNGPLAYRLTRWGKMPYAPQTVASVTYTFYAGLPMVMMQSLVEAREDLAVHAIRNSELVFSRHQFDTAVWLTKDGKLQRAPCYDYNDKDKSFGEIVKLPPDVPCLGFANERKGYGVALVVLSMTNLNKHTGQAADEQAHFYIRDYDEHGKGSPANFVYLVRPVVYRKDYLPMAVRAGSVYAERNAIVAFRLQPDPDRRYDELLRWQQVLSQPLEVIMD